MLNGLERNQKFQQLKLIVDQLQHVANQLTTGQPPPQPPRERRATVPKQQQKDTGLLSLFMAKEDDIEVARAESLGVVELAKEAVGDTPPADSVIMKIETSSSASTPSSPFSAILRPRVTSRSQMAGNTELLERCFDKKKNF
uniref:Uncharacterized protein n=1 Tax=Ditylenchus dipsaci TaxID=166011 RepID=A0A915EAW8_9BILA